MNISRTRRYTYGRSRKRYSADYLTRMTIMSVFFLVSILVSVLLPIYFANMALHGF
jgi:hypothetical protein